MNRQGPPYYGKYRGVVTNNRDPKRLGRIRARVKDVLGDNESGWATPCTPYAGNNVGLFLMPPEKSSVWIEFEYGNSDLPIWTGGFWAWDSSTLIAVDTLPASPAIPETKVLKTDIATITINDSQGDASITIETKKGMKLVMKATGIEITNGQNASIKFSGKTVSINGNALEVS